MLSLTLNFTTGIAEITLDHLQGAGFFQMFCEVLPLNHTLSTSVGALHGVFLADSPALIGDFGVGSFVVTISANEWATEAIHCLVIHEPTSLETPAAVIRAGYCHKLALPLNRVLTQMSVKTAQLPHPLAPQALVWAVNFELIYFPLEVLIRHGIEISLLAYRTGLSL